MKLIMKIFLLMFLLIIVACQENEELTVSENNQIVENEIVESTIGIMFKNFIYKE